MFIYLLRGDLPWQNIRIADKRIKYELIKKKKTEITLEELCKDIPSEFVTYMKKVRKLKFEQTPDYKGLRSLLKDLFYRNEFEYDYNYDWMIKQRKDKMRDSPQKPAPMRREAIMTVDESRAANYTSLPRFHESLSFGEAQDCESPGK